MVEGEITHEIKTTEKTDKGKKSSIVILEGKDKDSLIDYAKHKYLKHGWRIKEKLHLIGWFNKRYRGVLIK
jgi:hypothetical protein